MPRGRGRKNKKEEKILDENLKIEVENKKIPKKVKLEEKSEDWLLNLKEIQEFLRVKKAAIAVAYVFDTSELASEDSVIKIKSKMIETLQNKATAKRMHINPDKIMFKTYPRGEKTYVKAYFYLYNATGRGAPQREEKQKMPEEGLWIQEPEEITE